MTVSVENSERSKFVELRSDFADVTFRSKTSYRTVFEYLRRSARRYLPVLRGGASDEETPGAVAAAPDDFSLLSVDIRNINPVADAVAAGAMTMFMPHGLGHGLGMDVHDCEAMGERSFDFSSIAQRAAKSATCIYRAAWRLEPGTVMTDEPGLYFIPALIDKCRAEGLYKGIVDYDALEGYRDFGGIRIEDDILVTESGSRMLGDKKIPVTVEELEAVVGR